MIDIFVINLESSTERREHISKQLDTLGLDFHIFSAVDGRKEPQPLFEMYNDKLSQLYRGKSLSSGQLGCYASHYLLWQKCVELGKPIIVLEDDAVIRPDGFLQFCRQCQQLGREFEFIRLHKHQRKRYSYTQSLQLEDLGVYRFTKGHMGTIGYYLTPEGAQKFLASSKQWAFNVDIMMDRFWDTQVECYGVIPECIHHDDSSGSDIGYSKKVKRTFLTRCKREWFNFTELVKRELHNFRFKLQNKVK